MPAPFTVTRTASAGSGPSAVRSGHSAACPRPDRTVRDFWLRFVLVALLLAGLLSAVEFTARTTTAGAATRLPGTPAGLPRAIEPLAAYVGQTTCQPTYLPGTLTLARILVATYPNTSYQGAYACGTDGSRSEHYDGRAIDWMNSVRNPTQRAQADAVLKWLLATDRYGNTFANARRLGVMYVIWNNRMWGAWDGKWEAYNGCAKTPQVGYDSACHRNHMHISLSWEGAHGATSFFTKRVNAVTDFGPCRPRDLNWAPWYSGVNRRGCADYAKVGVPAHATARLALAIQYSGAMLSRGAAGPAVLAVQEGLNLPRTSIFDQRTVNAVNSFARARHLAANSVMDDPKWRALLAALRAHG